MKKIASVCAALAVAGITAFAVKEHKASKGNISHEPDYLLVLGCRVRGYEPEEILKTRIKAAAKYLENHKNTVAVCCGGIVHPDQYKSEAQAMKEGLMAFGIEEERIILEDKSTTTEENFVNAKNIISERHGGEQKTLAFLSSEFHLMRASYIAKSVGVSCECMPSETPLFKRTYCYAREMAVYPVAIMRKGGK